MFEDVMLELIDCFLNFYLHSSIWVDAAAQQS